MFSEKRLFLALAFLLVLLPAFCQSNWMSRAGVDAVATGAIESYLLPELHRLLPRSSEGNGRDLDLTLTGPDNNSRSFELFWREAGDESSMMLKPDRVELKDDHQLLWEATVPQNYLFKSIQVNLPLYPDAARLTFEGYFADKWELIDKNIAVLRSSPRVPNGIASVKFSEKAFEKIRISFAGFDKEFKDTPVHSASVMLNGRRGGSGFQLISQELEFEEALSDEYLEVRVRMPGSGIMVESVEIGTEALFQGNWILGKEKIVLGKRELSSEMSGVVDAVGNTPNTIKIFPKMIWKDRTMVVLLKSKNFFGKITSVKCNMRLPRLVFVADIVGKYFIETGKNNKQEIFEFAGDLNRATGLKLNFSDASINSDWQSENFIKDFSIRGGPFNSLGYTWKAPIKIEKPGFYQLQVAAKVALENHLPGLRIVDKGVQIPYFIGRNEEREENLKFEQEYDSANNRSIFTVHLPDGNILPRYMRVKTSGIFERRVFVEKHEAGVVGWKTWKTMYWKNADNSEIDIHIGLLGFPTDQKELRLIVENGSNQSLKIAGISSWYSARDLFFVAPQKGDFELYGGNPSARAAKYDLAIVQDKLLELFPEKISHGYLMEMSETASATTSGQDKGGPFESSGYTWVASFSVPVTGLFQLSLNQKASLDNLRSSIRIVRNGNQIPYFAGESKFQSVPIKLTENYDRGKNLTTVDFALPVASKFWSFIAFKVPGVFSRKPVVQLRKPGKLGWKKWTELNWIGSSQRENSFALNLASLPKGETEIRIEISHGDNSPIVITSAAAAYRTQDLFFSASESGDFMIYGGNSGVKAPSYDISLIRDQLLKVEPQKIQMGEISQYSKIALQKQLEDVFSEKGWGLYIVLGFVTLILIGVIIKVFPEEQKKAEEKPAEKPATNSETKSEETPKKE